VNKIVGGRKGSMRDKGGNILGGVGASECQ